MAFFKSYLFPIAFNGIYAPFCGNNNITVNLPRTLFIQVAKM
ncbi:hypothetical protein CSC02_0827 [Enterobacter hormaechei subsp. hoffmannii]|nr:hypothetical protein CSC02_0827 [Enterobacter hormaechei subsp. hoffmannii]